jgi:hypothetical protein
MKTPRSLHYARLSRDRDPEPCTREQWRAWVDSPRYTPVLVREELDGWEADLTFTGTWCGRGTPKFFTVWVWISPPRGFSHLRQFATYEQAWRALGRVLAERWLQAEEGKSEKMADL